MSSDLSAVVNWFSNIIKGIRDFFAAGTPEPVRALPPRSRYLTPSKVDSLEHVSYHVEVDDRIIYESQEVVGEVHAYVPCTTAHLPWSLNWLETGSQKVICGTLKFENCAEAALFDEDITRTYHADDLNFDIPVQIPTNDIQTHFASGDTYQGIYRYHPRLSREFPVTISVDVSDAPRRHPELYLRLPEEDRSATYLEDIRLQIQIQAQFSNLSQDMEREIKSWIEDESRQARKLYETWRRVSDALAEKQKVEASLLKDLERENVPASDETVSQMEGYGHLSRCIQSIQDRLASMKGDLLIQDLRNAILEARRESLETNVNRQLVLDWLETLEKKVGKEHGPRFRYVGVEWPLPEPSLEWQPAREPFPGDGPWTYNPELGCLECRTIEAQWNPEAMYYSGEIELRLQRPAQAIRSVHGRVVVETDRLLSGLHVSWEPAGDSSRHKPPVRRTTVIELDFDVNLEAAFRRRRFALSRSLAFEGLLPSPARVRELKDVFADAGLTVVYPHKNLSGPQIEVGAIWRREGLPAYWGHNDLSVNFVAVLRGRQESAKHILSYDGDRQHVERSINVGSMGVEIRAIGSGSPLPVVEKVNELLLRLHERWSQGDVQVWQGTWYKEA